MQSTPFDTSTWSRDSCLGPSPPFTVEAATRELMRLSLHQSRWRTRYPDAYLQFQPSGGCSAKGGAGAASSAAEHKDPHLRDSTGLLGHFLVQLHLQPARMSECLRSGWGVQCVHRALASHSLKKIYIFGTCMLEDLPVAFSLERLEKEILLPLFLLHRMPPDSVVHRYPQEGQRVPLVLLGPFITLLVALFDGGPFFYDIVHELLCSPVILGRNHTLLDRRNAIHTLVVASFLPDASTAGSIRHYRDNACTCQCEASSWDTLAHQASEALEASTKHFLAAMLEHGEPYAELEDSSVMVAMRSRSPCCCICFCNISEAKTGSPALRCGHRLACRDCTSVLGCCPGCSGPLSRRALKGGAGKKKKKKKKKKKNPRRGGAAVVCS